MAIRVAPAVLRALAIGVLEQEDSRGWGRAPVLVINQVQAKEQETKARRTRSRTDDDVIGAVLSGTNIRSLEAALFRMSLNIRRSDWHDRVDFLAVSFEGPLPPWFRQREGGGVRDSQAHEHGRSVFVVTPDGACVEAMSWREHPGIEPMVNASDEKTGFIREPGLALHALLLAYRAAYRDNHPGDPQAEDTVTYDESTYRPLPPPGQDAGDSHHKVLAGAPHDKGLTVAYCSCGWASDRAHNDVHPAEQEWNSHLEHVRRGSPRQSPTVSGGLPGLGKRT